jgi:hypothetical protein
MSVVSPKAIAGKKPIAFLIPRGRFYPGAATQVEYAGYTDVAQVITIHSSFEVRHLTAIWPMLG